MKGLSKRLERACTDARKLADLDEVIPKPTISTLETSKPETRKLVRSLVSTAQLFIRNPNFQTGNVKI